MNQSSDKRTLQAALREAREVGCDGLVAGYAIQKSTGRRVHAFDVRKSDGPFFCYGCSSEAIHHHCTEDIRDHFAHFARSSPIATARESELHKSCKTQLFEALRSKFPSPNPKEWKWVCDDVRIKENRLRKLPSLQPDIGGRIDGRRVAIEVQCSTLTVPQIVRRCLGYSARNVSILWILPLREPIGQKPFRPRHFERYLHSIYFGRVYYWLPEFGNSVLPVHFGLAWTHVEYKEWYQNGEHHEAGNYDKPYKRIRSPYPHPLIPIESAFYHRSRDEHRPWNERRTVPAMKIFMDKCVQWWKDDEEEVLSRFYLDENPDEADK